MGLDTTRWNTAIVWFRRDLRLADNPALSDAVAHARQVVPLFVVDERLLQRSPARSWFLARSIEALDQSLRDVGSALVVRSGPAEQVVADVAREVRADVVLATRDVTPLSYRRDSAVAAELEHEGRRLLLRPGVTLVEPEQLLSGAGKPYSVFTPFWRALSRAPRRQLLPTPVRVTTKHEALPPSTSAGITGWASRPQAGLPDPGEHAAARRLRDWVSVALPDYGERRDDLAGETTSHLGADLHFGTLSPGMVEAAASERGGDATPFIRQLAWREFYHHQLFHRRSRPSRISASPFMAVFRSEEDDPVAVAAWREGRTGIPVVDAGMRQLAATGWLSNRARLVVASFLTRHLLMDYRIGERHFLRHLIDGDVANNVGGWQWTAGVGADAQPWFRIFNPVLQGRRFDPEGEWVRTWLPELRSVPNKYIHAPWDMPSDIAKASAPTLGGGYPLPIVDLAFGRERALAAFKAARGSG
jgi:deoxyribodipyrimidine photo-lyase